MDNSWIEPAARGAALLLAALLLHQLLRRAPARVRGAVLLATLTGLLLLPVATRLLPRWNAAVLPRAETPVATSDSVAASDARTSLAATGSVSLEPTYLPHVVEEPLAASPAPRAALATPPAVASAPPAKSAPLNGIALLWLGGVLLVIAPWVVGLLRTAAWARGRRALDRRDVQLPRRVPVGVHPAVASPLTAGLLRPVVLLPVDAETWPRSTLQAALLHEAAHARRRDVLAGAVARAASALHWFNPLVWWAAAQLRRDSELACDDAVLASGMAPPVFAQALVTLARSSRDVRLHGAVASWGGSGLERRIEAALRKERRPRRQSLRVAAALVLGLVFVTTATLHPTRALHAEEESDATVVTVGPEGCDHTTIQAAVDAAPTGALVRISPGLYEERVVVEKALTLAGAGWTKTRLESPFELAAERGQRPHPTLLVRNASGVVLRGLRITLEGTMRDGVAYSGAVVDLVASQVRVEGCALIHSPASGIDISGDADVVVERCLVTSVGSTGIAIGSRGAGMPKVRILDCDLRYGHHRCVTIGASCNDVVIEGCRISGSGWHGIRYDDASPTIRRNRITDNVRSAIYASGRTRAEVVGNLFADMGMGAVGCWGFCGDVIEGNTFAHNARSGLAILGAANPVVTRNLFVDSPVGVRWSGVAGGRGRGTPSEGLGTVSGNVFWKTETDLSKPLSVDPPNERLDPRLGEDYTLPAGSMLRARGIGAADLPSATSSFPVQPEEEQARRLYQEHLARYGEWPRAEGAPVPRARAPRTREAHQTRVRAAVEKGREWMARIRSVEDAADRRQALKEVYDAFVSDDDTLRLAALRTAGWLGTAEYDRDAFRVRIFAFAHAEDDDTRYAARLALVRVKPDPSDLPLWLDVAQTADRNNAETTAECLVRLADGVVEGKVADAVLHLLRDGTDVKKAFVVRGLQSAKVFDPRVEARMIEIVRSVPAHDYDSVYYFHWITPHLDPKSDAVVDVMLDRAGEGEYDLQRTLRGLRVGLTDAQRKRAADRLFEILANTGPKYPRTLLLQALESVVDASHVEKLETLAGRDGLDAAAKALLDELLRAARGR